MSVVAPPRPVQPVPTIARSTVAPQRRRSTLFQPGWPLAWLFVGYPLWWLLGTATMMTVAVTIIMAFQLYRRGHVKVPRGFGFWMLFLGFSVISLVTLQVAAPGAVAGVSNTRYPVWAFRMMWYVAGAVVLLYIGNMRKELPLERVARILGWMFVTIIFGGLLGTLAPHLDFPSAIELVLPHSLTNIGFIQRMVHPSVAQIQPVLGYSSARPSAPFDYTNTWGLAYACFLPFFVRSWLAKGAGWRRVAGPILLAVSIVPVIGSLNRGLWGALIGTAIFVTVRFALMGRVRMLVALVLAGIALSGVVVATPLGNTIVVRLQHQQSNQGRTHLGTLTVTSTLDKSPIIGFGTTRNVQGNFNSIAGGSSSECPKCTPPALGTQGQAWLLIFTTGVGGLLMYGGFFASQFIPALRRRTPATTTGACVLVAHAITCIVYDVNGPGLLAIMAGVGFLWRDAMDHPLMSRVLARPVPASRDLAGYGRFIRQHIWLVGGLTVVGGVVGVALPSITGTPTTTTAFVNVGLASIPGTHPLTLDSESQYVYSAPVLSAVSKAIGRPADPAAFGVAATPNSRVLHISYTAGSAAKSLRGAEAAANELIAVRGQRLRAAGDATAGRLATQMLVARAALTRSQSTLRQLQAASSNGDNSSINLLNASVHRQVVDLARMSRQRQRAVTVSQATPGVIAHAVLTKPDTDRSKVGLGSGLAVGLLLGLMLASNRDSVSTKVGSARRLARDGFRVLAVGRGPDALPEIGRSLRNRGIGVVLAVDDDDLVIGGAATMDSEMGTCVDHRRGGGAAVALVVSHRSRFRPVRLAREGLVASGAEVAGVVLLDYRRRLHRPSITQRGRRRSG